MKNRARITTLMVVISCLSFFYSTSAQSSAIASAEATFVESAQASVSKDFVIQIPEEQSGFSGIYLLNIENLGFKSEEALTKFCDMFSFDFQILSGDFKNHQIKLELKLQELAQRGFSRNQVNRHFELLSKRMVYYFQKINK